MILLEFFFFYIHLPAGGLVISVADALREFVLGELAAAWVGDPPSVESLHTLSVPTLSLRPSVSWSLAEGVLCCSWFIAGAWQPVNQAVRM